MNPRLLYARLSLMVAVAAPRPPITWQDYILHGPTRAFARPGNLKKFFRRRKGKDAVLAGGRKFCQLDGTYSLGSLPGPGSIPHRRPRFIRSGQLQKTSVQLGRDSGPANRQGQSDRHLDLRRQSQRSTTIPSDNRTHVPSVTSRQL